jgi:parallel beta-helix repeat protein
VIPVLLLTLTACSSDTTNAPNAPPPTTMPPPPPGATPPVNPPPAPPSCTPAPCVSLDATASEEDVQRAFATAAAGETILLGAGTFHLTGTISIAANNLTVRGAGKGVTVLDFSGQTSGSEGIFAEGVSSLVLEDFTVKNTKGNGVKVLGSKTVTFRRIEATWTGADPSAHGPYGLYPVSSKDILVEACTASGASDSGIYLGQSDGAIIRQNEVFGNVAGIEVENTFDADVLDNHVHDNAGGILVFDLPGLPQKGGHAVRVSGNEIATNNTANFAPAGNTVGMVPRGTGLVVMANAQVEVFGNTFKDNLTVQAAIISYLATGQTITDATYYPFPAVVALHDNTFSGATAGTQPDSSKDLGLLLASGLSAWGGTVPNVVYDGIVDPSGAGGPPTDPMKICVHANGAASFTNLHLDKFDSAAPNLPAIETTDATPYDCTLPALPAVPGH